MTNTTQLPNRNQEPARKRLQQLQAFCWASFSLGARTRKELGKLTNAYNREHRLDIPVELVGQTILFVLADGGV